jgi:hypothetical protein
MAFDETKCATAIEKVGQLEVRADKMDVAINLLKNRLPVWATLILTGMGGTIGLMAGFLISNGV